MTIIKKKRIKLNLEKISNALSEKTGGKALMDLIIPADSFIQVLALKGIYNWSKCLSQYQRGIMTETCYDGWLNEIPILSCHHL